METPSTEVERSLSYCEQCLEEEIIQRRINENLKVQVFKNAEIAKANGLEADLIRSALTSMQLAYEAERDRDVRFKDLSFKSKAKTYLIFLLAIITSILTTKTLN